MEIDEEYNDEIEQFISIFKFLARNNLNIKKSLDEIIESGHVKYSVSPHLFNSLVEMAAGVVKAIHKMD